MTVVTGDGEIREVTPEREPDLFWGLRGGKGNLAIVTDMTVELVPVGHIYGGGIYFRGDAAPDGLHAYREWSATLSEQTSTSISLLRLPPMPDVPEPLRGRLSVHLRVPHVGNGGAESVAPMRAVAPVLIDGIGDMPYTAVDMVHQDPDHPVPAYERVELLPTLSTDVVDRLLDVAGPQVQTPVLFAELRQLGGALARQPEVPSAVTGRDAGVLLVRARDVDARDRRNRPVGHRRRNRRVAPVHKRAHDGQPAWQARRPSRPRPRLDAGDGRPAMRGQGGMRPGQPVPLRPRACALRLSMEALYVPVSSKSNSDADGPVGQEPHWCKGWRWRWDLNPRRA
jgi:hypothetical protein